MSFSPKVPSGHDWTHVDTLRNVPTTGATIERWRSGPILALSSVDMAKLPGSPGVGPQWHVSISATGKRPKPHHVRRALRAFGMVDAEEDNHHPGVARHFLMPVDPAERVDCECKADEVTVVEPDGYRWSNEPGGCRGCELARTFAHVGGSRPCPYHPEARP